MATAGVQGPRQGPQQMSLTEAVLERRQIARALKKGPGGAAGAGKAVARHPWLLHLPKRYQDVRAAPAPNGDGDAFCGPMRVLQDPYRDTTSKGQTVWQFAAACESIEFTVSLFCRHPKFTTEWKDLERGATVLASGQVMRYGKHLYLRSPVRVPENFYNRIAPVYLAAGPGRSREEISRRVTESLSDRDSMAHSIEVLKTRLHPLPVSPEFLEQVLLSLHSPDSLEEAEHAQIEIRRLSVQSVLSRRQDEALMSLATEAMALPDCNEAAMGRIDQMVLSSERILSALTWAQQRLPFTLSESQRAGILTILDSLSRHSQEKTGARILVSGDVGSGKTVTYLIPVVIAMRLGLRVGVLIPNRVLLDQVFTEAQKYFPDEKRFFWDSARAEKATAQDFDSARFLVLFGTTGLNHALKRWGRSLDLLVIDEQQKMGHEQRMAGLHKASHLIEATATAIPRTLGRVRFGDTEIVRIRQHAKKDLVTQVVELNNPNTRKRMVQVMKDAMARKERVLVVYPLVEGDMESRRYGVESAAAQWERTFPGQVQLLHGDLSDEDKVAALNRVKTGERLLLVSSSIVEVGVTIPDLRTLIVVEADRYGVSTLHQMRGRLARSGGKGYAFLGVKFMLNDPELSKTRKETIERLKLLETLSDGFDLAERDMQLRGFGSLFGNDEKQTGKTLTPFEGLKLTPRDFDLYGN